MATTAGPRRATVPRSGGKMVRARPAASPRTPYDRPSPKLLPDSPEPQNWLSRLILSPTRVIATGAGKVIASVFGPESPSSSSSSSSSDDSSSANDIDDADDDNDISTQGANMMLKTSGMLTPLRKDPQVIEWKSETKRAIEWLLMQETFSREECDRLTDIIKSRVVDSSIIGGAEDRRITETQDKTIGSDADMPDLRSTAVTEAKKWLEEKKLGSSPKLEPEYGICTLNTAMSLHVPEDEMGSPADLAKSYMRAQPSWASPSVDHIQFGSPSLIGLQRFKEETSYSSGRNSMCSPKVGRSPATASWSIQDEIRKVRSRATEEMLRTRPSSKIDWSSLASGYKRSPYSLVFDKNEAAIEDKICESTQAIDTSLTLVSGVTTCDLTEVFYKMFGNGTSFSDLSVSRIGQDGFQNEASPSNLATPILEQNQEVEAMPVTNGKQEGIFSSRQGRQSLLPPQDVNGVLQSDAAMADNPKDFDGTNQQLSSMVGGTAQEATPDSRLHEVYCSKLEEVSRKDGSIAVNGFSSSGSRLPVKEHSLVGSGNENVTVSVTTEGTHNLLSEDCVDVPIVEMPIIIENDDATNASQNSSSAHLEWVAEDLTQSSSKRKASSVSRDQEGKKLGRYNRKGGRGRGK